MENKSERHRGSFRLGGGDNKVCPLHLKDEVAHLSYFFTTHDWEEHALKWNILYT